MAWYFQYYALQTEWKSFTKRFLHVIENFLISNRARRNISSADYAQ